MYKRLSADFQTFEGILTMRASISTTAKKIWRMMQSKTRRDAYVASHISNTVASQILMLREAKGWTQKQLAEKCGMRQSRISTLEDPNYENFEAATLRRLASAFDVGLTIRFIPFNELVDWVTTISPEKLAPPSFENDTPRDLRSDPSRVPTEMRALSTIPAFGQETIDQQTMAATQPKISAIPFRIIQGDKQIEPFPTLSQTGLDEMDDPSSSRSGVLPTTGNPIVVGDEVNSVISSPADLSAAQSAMVIELATFRQPRQNLNENTENHEIQRELMSVMVDVRYA
jgi:transcriptional regulator with XRE-family HTH domain